MQGLVWLSILPTSDETPSFRQADAQSDQLTHQCPLFFYPGDWASVSARPNSFSDTPCAISHFPLRVRTGNEQISPFLDAIIAIRANSHTIPIAFRGAVVSERTVSTI